MKCFAYYRLPYADQFTCIESESAPLILDSVERVGESAGFLVAPFISDADHPIVLIRPERISYERCKTADAAAYHNKVGAITENAEYSQIFKLFHTAVTQGRFKKLVLARSKNIETAISPENYKAIFERTYLLYPRLMIMLFSTPLTGTWIVASPEILVDGAGQNLHTIALAGTMPYAEGYPEWSGKNKAEQNVVERYIENVITPLCTQVTKDGPVTMRAGNLVHLRTDFRFLLESGNTLGKLITQLHPTPAICGIPKDDAIKFIQTNESLSRGYYSGFAGPVGINNETHLYVSLRCAKLSPSSVTLFAGGGIMPESTVQSEWLETERKMETIGNVLK